MTDQTITSSVPELHIERVLSAPPARIWQALTHPAELSKWMGDAEVQPGPQGQFLIRFDEQQSVCGQVIQWLEPYTLEYEWNFTDETSSIVRFDLIAHPAGTLLRVRHRRLPTAYAAGYQPGWQAHLDLLEGALIGRELIFWERYEHWRVIPE